MVKVLRLTLHMFLFGWNGTQTHEKAYGLIYLYNFNSASIKSYGTFEVTAINYAGNLRGFAGGFSYTVASASDGVTFGTQMEVILLVEHLHCIKVI